MAGIDSFLPPDMLSQLLGSGQITPETAQMVQDRYPQGPQPVMLPNMPLAEEPAPAPVSIHLPTSNALPAQTVPPPPEEGPKPNSIMPTLETLQAEAKKGSGLDPKISAAIEKVESGGNPNAVSPKGAVGTHQVMPDAMRDVLHERFNMPMDYLKTKVSDEQLRALAAKEGMSKLFGESYYQLIKKRNPTWSEDQVRAAYNGGPTLLGQKDGNIGAMPKESQDYVRKVGSAAGDYSGDTVEPFESASTTYDKGQMSEAYGAGQQAITKGALEQQDIADKLAQTRNEYVKEQEALQLRENAMQERSMKLIEESRIAMQKASEAYLSGGVDPNRLYSKASTGDKILAAIGIALGGLAGGMAGNGKNSSLDLITGAIDKDIEQQKVELTKKGNYAEMKRQEFNSLVTQFGSQEAAWQAKRSILLANAKQITDSLGEQSKSAKAKADAGEQSAKLEAERLKTNMKIEEDATKRPERQALAIDKYYRGEVQLGELPEDARVRVMPGIGTLVTKEDRTEAQKAAANLGRMNENIDFLIRTRSKNRGNLTDLELQANVFSNAQELLLNYKDVYGLGALQPREVEIITSIVGDPTSWSLKSGALGQDQVLSVLKNLKERSKRTTEIKLMPMIERWDPKWTAQNDTSITARPR